MLSNVTRFVCYVVFLGAVLAITACSQTPTSNGNGNTPATTSEGAKSSETPNDANANDEEHEHVAGAHGGIIVSLGRDSYHVEAIVTETGELHLYTLGNDESRVVDIEVQELTAYVKSVNGTESTSLTVRPHPQSGDEAGKASLFVGQLPDSLIGQALNVTIPNISISGERFRLGFTTEVPNHDAEGMPNKLVSEEERGLYLTPGGLYTQEDIVANGNQTASQKFTGFKASHDFSPDIGDKICPVTQTKANPKCSWIVGGKVYEFCCPPCVDEFLTLAKTKPQDVKQPDEYVKR